MAIGHLLYYISIVFVSFIVRVYCIVCIQQGHLSRVYESSSHLCRFLMFLAGCSWTDVCEGFPYPKPLSDSHWTAASHPLGGSKSPALAGWLGQGKTSIIIIPLLTIEWHDVRLVFVFHNTLRSVIAIYIYLEIVQKSFLNLRMKTLHQMRCWQQQGWQLVWAQRLLLKWKNIYSNQPSKSSWGPTLQRPPSME